MLTAGRTRSPTVPPSTRRSSSLHQRVSTPHGSVAPSWPPSQPSSSSGSPRRSTTSPASPSSIGNTSRLEQLYTENFQQSFWNPSNKLSDMYSAQRSFSIFKFFINAGLVYVLIQLKGAHPCTSSSGQGGGKRVLEDFF